MLNHICNHCGCVLDDEEVYLFSEEVYCQDCFDELTVVCDHCGRRLFRTGCETDGHIHLCNNCYSYSYVSCDRCGRFILSEYAHYEDDDEDIPYCATCYQEATWIHSYNYKPDPVFHGAGDRFFGVELEVDNGGEIHANARRIIELAGDRIYCKHDGSLNEGFEVVTHPMTLDYHCTQMPWKGVLDTLKEMGYRSHQTDTAGLHIHINRTSLGTTYDEQDDTISRILFFFEKHWNELVKFSRRTGGQLARWADRYGYKESPKDILKTAKGGYGRYAAVNLCCENTLEFRIFRGSLKYNTLIAALQLVNRICDVAISLSDDEVKGLSWTAFVAGCTEPELIQYLKERRLYVNELVESEGDL